MCLAGEPIAALFRIPGFQHWFERGDAPGGMIELDKHSLRCRTPELANTVVSGSRQGSDLELSCAEIAWTVDFAGVILSKARMVGCLTGRGSGMRWVLRPARGEKIRHAAST